MRMDGRGPLIAWGVYPFTRVCLIGPSRGGARVGYPEYQQGKGQKH